MSKRLTEYNDEALTLLCLRVAAAKGLSEPALKAFGLSVGAAAADGVCQIDWQRARRDLEALLQP